jgi:DNA polymerase III alpha subunit (gram-positive type)
MKSPYKKIIVYDLETGGFKSEHNSITEAAFVCIDLENLEIVDEMSVMILPYFDLSNKEEDSIKEAKEIYKQISEKDSETGKKVLLYKGAKLNLKDLGDLPDDIEEFESLFLNSDIMDYKEIEKLLSSSQYNDITQMFFDKAYTKGALEATHMNKELLVSEGVDRNEAADKIQAFFNKHTVGNSKPILAGHNIKKFDNPFLESFLRLHKIQFNSIINQTQMIDTLEWARLRWYDMPSYALGVVANELNVTLKGAHRALPDTVANAKVLVKMLQSFRGEGVQESTYTRKKLTMNF